MTESVLDSEQGIWNLGFPPASLYSLLAAMDESIRLLINRIIADSGSSQHMSSYRNDSIDFEELTMNVGGIGPQDMQATGIGTF
jgi:hypothetical protein